MIHLGMTKHLYLRKALVRTKTNKTGTSEVGAIHKAYKAQFLNYEQDVFMKNSCFEHPPTPYKNAT